MSMTQKKQHLCIYYRKVKEWDETKYIADKIIPWTIFWTKIIMGEGTMLIIF